MDDYNTFRYTICAVCGNRFKDDCGDVFCSGSCENEWEHAHEPCTQCGEEVGEDNLNHDRICENCEEEE